VVVAAVAAVAAAAVGAPSAASTVVPAEAAAVVPAPVGPATVVPAAVAVVSRRVMRAGVVRSALVPARGGRHPGEPRNGLAQSFRVVRTFAIANAAANTTQMRTVTTARIVT